MVVLFRPSLVHTWKRIALDNRNVRFQAIPILGNSVSSYANSSNCTSFVLQACGKTGAVRKKEDGEDIWMENDKRGRRRRRRDEEGEGNGKRMRWRLEERDEWTVDWRETSNEKNKCKTRIKKSEVEAAEGKGDARERKR